MSKLEIFVSLSAYSVVPVVYSFVLGCLFVLKYVVMCIDGVGWNFDMFYILWTVVPFWTGQT
jgi:hypothetical protein